MGQISILDFIIGQWTTVPPVEKADLTGKVVLVVGANTGIGFETAKHFATMNPAKLILGCRSQERGAAALQRIKESTGYERGEVWLIDLSRFASVKQFSDRFENEVDRLDILVANAASLTLKYQETEDEWESSLQINYLASALLILLLLPKMFKAAEQSSSTPRVVIVSSELHQYGKVPGKAFEAPSALEALSSQESGTPYNPRERYHLSKLLNVLFAFALTDHLPATKPTVIANSVNPGFCYSELRRSVESFFTWIMEKLLARTAEEGSRQVIWAAISGPSQSGLTEGEKEERMKGAYVSLAKVEEPSDFVIGEKGKTFRDILWKDTLKALSKVDPRVEPICQQYLKG